uniref:[histone H3]-lysine(4) N-trimethyltransferase n=1 Tax=Anser brachyrhynchus TaxID=132585 RepID=A0A8B9CN71_9AVES
MEAAALERFRSPGKGSGLRSRRRVRPGELLYRAEPFAYVVSKELLGGVCERCLRRNEHLHRCSQCKVAKYCGKSCQKEAWLDHKQECKCLKNIKPNFPPDSVRLAGRIVFKLLRQLVCVSERLYSFSDLQSNTEQLSEEMKDGLRHLAHTLQLYLKAEIEDASHLPAAIDFFQIFTKCRKVSGRSTERKEDKQMNKKPWLMYTRPPLVPPLKSVDYVWVKQP